MAFSFQYYVGEIKTLATKDHVGRVVYNQFLPSGSHYQTYNRSLLNSSFESAYADSHVLGKNHIKAINALVKPLYGFRLVNETCLIATLEDKTQLEVSLNNGKLEVKKLN